ncbi:condensin complex subunit 2/barren [Phyllosticta capitalensis]
MARPTKHRLSAGGVGATPKSGIRRVPLNDLNDDKQEKAKRLQSRQLHHEAAMNQIRAAATPNKRRLTFTGRDPQTPLASDESFLDPRSNGFTPMRRGPILANFEEMIKMATDNKINAANSWSLELIDYFHEMSLLREGDNINFQKASTTLDGCVKVYTNRIDSVATETGKLLSGLATSNDKKRKSDVGDEERDAEGDEDEEGEDGHAKKKTKKKARAAEATLVSSFSQVMIKKMELELSVDPLFKKAAADFDEGGAKGLLMNNLSIDSKGRIVFDSSDDVQDATEEMPAEESEVKDDDEEEAEEKPQPKELDLSALGAKFFPNLSVLDGQDICPSLKGFDIGDPDAAVNLPFLKASEDWRNEQRANEEEGEDDAAGDFLNDGFDDDDGALGGFDLPAETGFGEGGEVWAREAALDPQMRVHKVDVDMGDEEGEDAVGKTGGFDVDSSHYEITMGSRAEQEHILSYFDKTLSKNWAGPEHWRIRRIKDASKPQAPAPAKRKEKVPFEIDFSAPMTQPMADSLYTKAARASILLPKAQWQNKTRNLLPDDKHFNSKQLLHLFIKPNARVLSRNKGSKQPGNNVRPGEDPKAETDEVIWARHNDDPTTHNPDPTTLGVSAGDDMDDDGMGMPHNADFFQDDEEDIFADAREMFSPHPEDGHDTQMLGADGMLPPAGTQDTAFGAQLVTAGRRLRPEYVQYARRAKQVDLRLLKDNIWKGIGLTGPDGESEDEEQAHEQSNLSVSAAPKPTPTPVKPDEEGTLMFTDVMNALPAVYPQKAMADISTSYCFICLLHLANEKGLMIENQPEYLDLKIRKDDAAIAGLE